MDSSFKLADRLSVINVTHETVDESCISIEAEFEPEPLSTSRPSAGGDPRSAQCRTVGVKMQVFAKDSWVSRQIDVSAPTGGLTKAHLPGSAEHKPPNDPSVAGAPPGPRDLLTAEQERVMVEHLPIVRFIARRIHDRLPPHVPIEDLYSAGVLGLLDAFGKFDPSKQVLFRTYAQFRIRGAILDSLRTLDWSPRESRRKARAVEEAIQMLTGELTRSTTDIEIAQKLNIPLAAYQQLLGELKGLEVGSLHAVRTEEDSGDEELVYASSRPEDDPLFRYLDGEMRERLTTAINALPERERLIMTLYYYEEATMKEIGLVIGVVESRVSQIHASAVLHLRARLAMSATLKEPQNKPGGDHSERAHGREARQRIAVGSS
jgi:RNA polymerase sigma factor for flagellar operon FliA